MNKNTYRAMTKSILLVILIMAIPNMLMLGQSDYYATDSLMSVGIKLVDGGDKENSRTCQVEKKDMIVRYSPYEVKEFGYKDGRVYLSKQVQLQGTVKKVFLERLYKGKATLYYYRGKDIKTFFIENDTTLFLEIPRYNKDEINYRKQLMDLTSDCPNISDATKLVTYNKKSLTKLISRYNNCELKPFPHFKYGVTTGYEFAKLIPSSQNESEYINYFNFKYDGGLTLGLFIDNPIWTSDFSLHAEFYYSKHGYSYNERVDIKDIDFIVNISTLKLPVLIRYIYLSDKFRPFINVGGVVAYNIKNENLLYETTISNNIIEINGFSEPSLISSSQAGWSVGFGYECKLNLKNSLFFELRYNKLYTNNNALNQSVITILTGINF
jgi:hypothetical protein